MMRPLSGFVGINRATHDPVHPRQIRQAILTD
jgi:hypothetical protein